MINLNKIIDSTAKFGILRFAQGSSVGQEVMNFSRWEKWKCPCSVTRKFDGDKDLIEYVMDSHWVDNQHDVVKDRIRIVINGIYRAESEWDGVGVLESIHDEDPCENDLGWVDNRKPPVHGVYFVKNRDLVIWFFTDNSFCNEVVEVGMPAVKEKPI